MAIDLNTTGYEIHRLISELYPICRSITGNGVRQTLHLINEYIQLSMQEVPTGTRVFDWIVPKEWNIRDGYVKNSRGEKIIDFQKSNLHVVGYSIPIHQKMSLEELRPRLFTLPEYPDWIPYRNSYYTENWGFCLSHRQFLELKNDVYEVFIDSSLEDGYLTYGEYYLEGNTKKDEVLISCHICHPSLCNDNLSGIAVAVFLARHLSSTLRRHSYRFLFLPTTIGSITWLALNETELSSIKHGLVLACLGDSGMSTYKKSRLGNTVIDRAAVNVLKHSGQNYEIMDFLPYGYDERQFCSPGFNLPVGCFMRTPNGCFPEYHTSADDLDFVQPDSLHDSFLKCTKIFNILDNDGIFMNQNPKCEPQLGKRGLYRPLNRQHQLPNEQLALLWVLNLSDGNHSLLDIAERSGMGFEEIRRAAGVLDANGLIIRVNG